MQLKRYGFGLGLVWLLAGCAHTRLVQQSTNKSDSTTLVTSHESVKKDSSFFKQEVKEKTLKGSSVDVVITNCDSLQAALRALPKSVTRSIYRTDPTSQTTIAIYEDSIGRMHFKCQTADRKYNELITTQGRIIDSKTKESEAKDVIIKILQEQIRQHEDSIFTKVGKFFKNGIWFVLIAVALLFAGWFIKKRGVWT
jgi:hypothetical protein